MLTLKHGGHRWSLTATGPLAVTTQAQDIQPYDFGLSRDGDPAIEKVVGGTMFSTLAIAATGTLVLSHVSSNGTTIDSVSLTSSFLTNTMTDLTTLPAQTGVTLAVGWTLNIGDSVILTFATGATAQTTQAAGVTIYVGVPS